MGSIHKSAIKIYCRLKPIQGLVNEYEVQTVNHETGEEILKIRDETVGSAQHAVNNKLELYTYRFSRVFERKTKQDYIFEQVAKPVIDSALQGFNGTIFAYGQTGSGKTFTMTGSRNVFDHRGIIPRTLQYIFEIFQKDDDPSKVNNVFVSYLEIYNEGGYDLLNADSMPGRLEDLAKVTLMEDGNQQMHLRNLSVHSIESVEEAIQLLYLGDHNRTVAETPLNEVSTRSHCIFTVHLSIRDTNTSLTRRSKLHLVDLAGSERVSNSSITGQLLTEARHINLALHYLEQVIVALSDTNRTHIPYRNSMMTSVLRDSLGGNCMTSMIATLSLEPRNIQETLSTCRFAQRVALVTNAAVRNEDLDPTHVIAQMKNEIRKLKEVIATSTVKPLSETSLPLSDEEQADCCALVEQFIRDPDRFAILPIIPDMRLIQECFRVLKAHLGIPKKMSSSAMRVYGSSLSGMSLAGLDNSELLHTIARRDAEIKVLMDMIRKEKEKLKRVQSQASSKESLNCIKLDDGLLSGIGAQQGQGELINANASLPPLPRRTGNLNTSRTDVESLNSFSNIPGQLPESRESDAHATTPPPSREEDSMIQGLTEGKRLALATFMENYAGTGTLENIRASMLKKRAEVRTLESMIGMNKTNMQSLKSIVSDPLSKSELDVQTLSDALSSQQRTSDMQGERLNGIREEVTELEMVLKGHYRKLMVEFEDWWNEKTAESSEMESDRNQKEDFMFGVGNIMKRSEVETKHVLRDRISGWSSSTSSRLGTESLANTASSSTEPFKYNAPPGNNALKYKSPEEIRRSIPKAPPVTPATANTTLDLDLTTTEDDDDALENALLTGDAETDEEIIQFLKARKQVYRKMQLMAKSE